MKFLVFLLLSFFFLTSLHAQNDFVLLKKNGYTIDHYFKGSPIAVYTKQHETFQGYVAFCRNDSIFIHIGYKGLKPTMFGSVIDTIYLGMVAVNIHDVAIIPARRISAADVGNTLFKLLFIAGGVVAVNQINIEQPTVYLVQFAAGVVINYAIYLIKPFKNKKPKGYRIGKKFQLEYVPLSIAK
ncbi:MAG: hypothetical protein KGO81_00430 [Bacteroidota bacterium]|nr:hypothetical protein [Bacteroidota bacterium]